MTSLKGKVATKDGIDGEEIPQLEFQNLEERVRESMQTGAAAINTSSPVTLNVVHRLKKYLWRT